MRVDDNCDTFSSQGGSARTRMEFTVPARALLGFGPVFVRETKGNGVCNKAFHGWARHCGK